MSFMCGIAGMLFFDRGRTNDPDVRALVGRMGAQLARRGPDEGQLFGDDRLLLLFRRLSINDVAHGSQPFVDQRTGVVSATNGEIYNHLELRAQLDGQRFATRCDAEVVGPLAVRRGPDFPRVLRGMFASAVWDPRAGELTLARDRFGIKPLFYLRTRDSVLFASELKALLVHPGTPASIDWPALMAVPEGPGRYVMPSGIEEVAPAHAVVFGLDGSARAHRYWDIRASLAAGAADSGDQRDGAAERIDAYAEGVSRSVEEHLLSDVPLGIFLSGGIDSSLITAETTRHARDVHAFSVLHESTIACGDVANAVRVAGWTGARLHFLDCRGDDLHRYMRADLAFFEYFVWAAEKPWFSLEDVFKQELHRLAKRAVPGIKVMLLGQGADEFAGGYSHQAGLGVSNRNWADYLGNARGSLRRHAVHPLLRRDFDADYLQEPWGAFGRQLIYHAEETMRVLNLRTEDRVSAAQGIEARVPFLDHRLVELLASTPADLQPGLFWDKRIVREALARRLPNYPASEHRKHPFVFTGDLAVPGRQLLGLLAAVFPQFRDSYLDDPRSPLDKQATVRWFEDLTSGRRASYQEIEGLQAGMSMAVWDRWLRRLKASTADAETAVAFEGAPVLPELLAETQAPPSRAA